MYTPMAGQIAGNKHQIFHFFVTWICTVMFGLLKGKHVHLTDYHAKPLTTNSFPSTHGFFFVSELLSKPPDCHLSLERGRMLMRLLLVPVVVHRLLLIQHNLPLEQLTESNQFYLTAPHLPDSRCMGDREQL